mmetsp:Transcript_20936/g.41790  ORF Transcript_20936/g.41790 Transcript_20936/m.41790 type:complete len:219 (-) Transcript_20936:3-659(-)
MISSWSACVSRVFVSAARRECSATSSLFSSGMRLLKEIPLLLMSFFFCLPSDSSSSTALSRILLRCTAALSTTSLQSGSATASACFSNSGSSCFRKGPTSRASSTNFAMLMTIRALFLLMGVDLSLRPLRRTGVVMASSPAPTVCTNVTSASLVTASGTLSKWELQSTMVGIRASMSLFCTAMQTATAVSAATFLTASFASFIKSAIIGTTSGSMEAT